MCLSVGVVCLCLSVGKCNSSLVPTIQRATTDGRYISNVHCTSFIVYCTRSFLWVWSGVVDYLTTEVATSKQKKFSFVTFIDTPGLVDGDMKYPFNVEEALTWLGVRADLILIFFDPLGQALCKRTLDIVGEFLCSQYWVLCSQYWVLCSQYWVWTIIVKKNEFQINLIFFF